MPDVLGLAILAHLAEKPDHGYALLKRPAPYAPPTTGGVYRRLRALEDEEVIVATWSTPERGPARRVYAITEAGRGHLATAIGPLDEFGRYVRGVLALATREAS